MSGSKAAMHHILTSHYVYLVSFVLHAVRMTSLQMTAKEELVERFLDAAAKGDLAQVSTLLSHTSSLVNEMGYSGWTALMLAARNGHYDVVEALLSQGYGKLRLRQWKTQKKLGNNK